jgi:hypothetical protein
MSDVRWKRGPSGDITPTGAQLAALEDFRAVHGNPTAFTRVALTKDMAGAIGREHGLTRDELLQVMDEWLGLHGTRAAVPS